MLAGELKQVHHVTVVEIDQADTLDRTTGRFCVFVGSVPVALR